jgi:hypothetical protein
MYTLWAYYTLQAYYNSGVTLVAPFFISKREPSQGYEERGVLSQELTDGVIRMRPFQLLDADETFAAVRESLADLKPWLRWAHVGYAFN